MTLLMKFKEYVITRSQTVTEPTTNMPSGSMTTAMVHRKYIYIFHLEGGSEKNDPLKEYRILELVVTRVDDNKLFITGIRNGQDCFEDHGTKDQVSYMNQRYEHFVENILLL